MGGELTGGEGSLAKNLIVEGLGTFMFAYVFLYSGKSEFIFLSVVTVLNWCCFALSGAHFNPVITLSLMVKNKIDPMKGVWYMVVQFCATLLSALMVYLNDTVPHSNRVDFWDAKSPRWRGGSDRSFFALIYEFVGTFIFIMIYFAAVIGRGGKSAMSGFIVGLGFMFASSMIGSHTGGVLNPFFYICPRLLIMRMKDIVWYILGPCLGGILGGFAYEPLIGSSVSEDETPNTSLA